MALWKQTKNNNLGTSCKLKSKFPFKNEINQIKALKPVYFFNNFSGDLHFVSWCLDYRAH